MGASPKTNAFVSEVFPALDFSVMKITIGSTRIEEVKAEEAAPAEEVKEEAEPKAEAKPEADAEEKKED